MQNPVGYLPTVLELDVKAGSDNLLAAYVDGGLTTGWWYEGSGLIRSARVRLSTLATRTFSSRFPLFLVAFCSYAAFGTARCHRPERLCRAVRDLEPVVCGGRDHSKQLPNVE